MTNELKRRIERRFDELKSKNLWRELREPSNDSVDLSSNDFLALAGDRRVKAAMIDEIARGGAGATGSRLLRGERAVFKKVEQEFAQFKNVERSLFFGSGYAANVGAISTFCEAGDLIFSDELNHASLIDGIRLSRAAKVVFPHNDFRTLEKLVAESPRAGQKFLVVESLFSMDGDFAPLREYAAICRKHNVALIVDEAHAVGVFGETGNGLIDVCGVADNVFLSINTAGKALGVGGAFVAGSGLAIEYLIQRARSFIFSTAPPPSVAAGLSVALEIVQREPYRREKLLALSRFLREKLNDSGINVARENSQIVPIILGASERAIAVANELQNNNFDVRAVRPPTVPANTARLRVSLNSNLDEAALAAFVEHLKNALRAARHDFC